MGSLIKGIYCKILIPLFIVGICVVIYAYFIWLPTSVNYAIKQSRYQLDKTLYTIAEGLVPLMLEEQLSNIYHNLDLVKGNNPNWIDLQLFNAKQESMYPLEALPIPQQTDVTHILIQPVIAGGKELGKIVVVYDFSILSNEVREQSTTLFTMILLAIVIFIILAGTVLYVVILHPISKITQASDALSQGNYDINIPTAKQDEVGVLIKSFDTMRDIIKKELSKSNQLNIRLNEYIEEVQTSQFETMEAQKKAEKSSKAKSEFLANMSHELRTPMNGILGLCEILLDSNLDEEQKDNTNIIYKSGQNLLSILNDILDISKIEADELEIENVPFDVGMAIHEMMQLFTPMAAQKQLELHDEKDDMPDIVIGDLGKIQQVLRNLINNALKFTEKGNITITSKTTYIDDKEYIYFAVKDTGIGIPKDKMCAIFEKFSQADTSVTRKFGGTGLGLAICQHLAYSMGGDIGVTSKEGDGSKFWFIVPLIPAEKDAKPVNLYSEKKDISNVTLPIDTYILAVDDHPVNREFIKKILSKLGFKNIDIAEDGKQALEMIDKNNYDIVLMDCQMPEIDGYQATILLREKEKLTNAPRLPIIALTANAMVGDREKCLKSGMDDYLSKPIKADRITALLKEWIGHTNHDHLVGDDIAVETDLKTSGNNMEKQPPIDMEHLNMFTDGNKDEEKELFDMFLKYAEESVLILENNCTDGQNMQWKSEAHKLKGSTANLGANSLSSICKEAELGYELPAKEKKELFSSIVKEFENVKAFIANLHS